MKHVVFILLPFIYLLFFINDFSIAEKSGMSPVIALKTKAIVDATYAFVYEHSDDMSAVQSALREDPRFMDRDMKLYVFIHCYNQSKKEAVCCGQAIRPELIGKNMYHLRTPSGRLLFEEIIQLIENEGEGWIEYEWLSPFTNRIQPKVSYVKGIVLNDGRKAWIGSGYWK